MRYNSVTGAYSRELTRDGLLDAFERIILSFSVNGAPIGSEIRAAAGSDLDVELRVHGTGELADAEVFACPFIEATRTARFGELRLDEGDPEVERVRASWTTLYERREIGALDFMGRVGPCFPGPRMVLYARVRQRHPIVVPCLLEGAAEHQVRDVYAWSSPVWVLEDTRP